MEKRYNWHIKKTKKSYIHYDHIKRAGAIWKKTIQKFVIENRPEDQAIKHLKSLGISITRGPQYREKPRMEKRQWSPYADD